MHNRNTQFTQLLAALLQEQPLTSQEEFLSFRSYCLAALEELSPAGAAHEAAYLAADEVTLEIINRENQQVFRRTVPLQFEENHNGLKLLGENLDGQPSEIVFLSQQGLAKLGDLMGKGPDEDQCHTHS